MRYICLIGLSDWGGRLDQFCAEHETCLGQVCIAVQGEFLHNMLQNQKSIVNTMAVNEDGVLASGADNGSLW